MQDVSEALSWLHSSLQVLHRDLKPANVFIASDGSAKLGDFGLVFSLASGAMARNFVGTEDYMAPEMLKKEPYSLPADIFALGT